MVKGDLELLTLLPLTAQERITGMYHFTQMELQFKKGQLQPKMNLLPSMPNF